MEPPSAITSLAISSTWGLIAAGCFLEFRSPFVFSSTSNYDHLYFPYLLITTIYIFLLGTAFGFLVFDTKCHHIVLTKATVNPPGEILVLMETTLCPPQTARHSWTMGFCRWPAPTSPSPAPCASLSTRSVDRTPIGAMRRKDCCTTNKAKTFPSWR